MRIVPDFDRVPVTDQSRLRPAFTTKVDYDGLCQISKRTAKFLGFQTKLSHPSHLIVTVLPVPPQCIRPSTDMHQNDLTTQLSNITKLNGALRSIQEVAEVWLSIRGPFSDDEKYEMRIDTERYYNVATGKYQTMTGLSTLNKANLQSPAAAPSVFSTVTMASNTTHGAAMAHKSNAMTNRYFVVFLIVNAIIIMFVRVAELGVTAIGVPAHSMGSRNHWIQSIHCYCRPERTRTPY
jgi:hypothetical protein